MTTSSGRQVGPVAGAMLREAIGRLLYGGATPSGDAITRFIDNASELGIDLGLIAAVVGQEGGPRPRVRQACMPVIGAGRTVMVFVSGPGSSEQFGNEDEQARDRGAAILGGLRLARERYGDRAGLVQALAEPGEDWAIRGYQEGSLRRIAELLYLSRPLRPGEARDPVAPDGRVVSSAPDGLWPAGITVRALRDEEIEGAALARALEESYEATLDCPELAGLRTLPDIVASHRAVGEFDPRLWWLVERGGSPEGCVLLNRCHQQRCTELVYIGLSVSVRGLGLGVSLMESAIAASAQLERELRCAVDARNAPARRVYERLGFREVGRRIAFIGRVDELLARQVPTG